MIRIPRIRNYKPEIVNETLILMPKYISIAEEELYKIDFTNSSIQSCIIRKDDKVISNKIYYRKILIDIWKQMSIQKILQFTSFNFKLTDENGINDYYWCKEIKMSFQEKSVNEMIIEIINMIKVNKMSMYLFIKIKSSHIVYLKI